MKRLSVLMVSLIIVGVLLSACGSSGDPVSVVKDLMNAVQSKNFDSIGNFACAAVKDQINSTFNPVGGLTGTGLDTKQALDAMTITLSDMSYNKTSESGDKATVQVKGKITIKLDREKFKALMSDLLKTQGGGANVTDDMINQGLDAATAQLEQTQNVDNPMNLIKENGKWVVCQ